jgi:flagellar biosynthesis protein FliQ
MKSDTKGQKILRVLILVIMVIGIVYAVMEAITNHNDGLYAYLPMVVMVPIAIYGIALFFPRKK